MSKYNFEDLTWEDLTAWAGERVMKRGKSYQSNVDDLCVTDDGRLLAWVHGTEQYATIVSLPAKGKPESLCTCPYGTACKHAVATILVYLNAIKAKKKVPVAKEDDERFEELSDFAEGDDEEFMPVSVSNKNTKNVEAYLKRLSKDALLHIFDEAMKGIPELGVYLANRIELESGDVAQLVKSARRAIRVASAEPGWKRDWSDDAYLPDYTPVRKRLKALLQAGHADEVVALGEELVDAGLRQIGQSDDEGETGGEVAECVGIVFQALAHSSMSDADKLLWERNVRLRERYTYFDDLPSLWDKGERFDATVWSEVADKLQKQVLPVPKDGHSKSDSDSFITRYERDQIMSAAYEALTWAGRADEITDLLRREAEITDCYPKLVDHLLSLKLNDEAYDWCRKGFAATIEKWPGIAKILAQRLHDRAQQKKDRPLVAAFLVDKFFDSPDVASFKLVEKATAPLGLWESVRAGMLKWLETGIRPELRSGTTSPKDTKSSGKHTALPATTEPRTAWPLPDTGLARTKENGRYSQFPYRSVLIEIAIYEKRNDDVLALYGEKPKHTLFGFWFGDQLSSVVADAVQETHPHEALAIWEQLAVGQIALVQPAAYEVAGGYLKKMKTVYSRLGKTAEWTALIAEIRSKNRPKRRLMTVLNQLEGIKQKPSKIIGS